MTYILLWIFGGVVVVLGGVMVFSAMGGGGKKGYEKRGDGKRSGGRRGGSGKKRGDGGGERKRHVHTKAVQERGSASGSGDRKISVSSGHDRSFKVVGGGSDKVGGKKIEVGPELVRGSGSNSGVAGEAGDLIGIGDAIIGSRVVIGSDGRDVEFVIDNRSRYEVDGDKWFELSGKSSLGRVSVELVGDGVCIVDFGDASFGLNAVGLSEDDLVRMDEGIGESEGVEYEGSWFEYEDSFECCYFENCRGGGERYYSWEFIEEDGGGRVIWVEKYEGEDFEASVGYIVSEDDFRVYRG